MGMFDKMKEAKNMYSNIKKAQNEINKIKVEGVSGACLLYTSDAADE